MTPRFITILQGKRIVAALFILALFGVCCFFFYEPCAKPPDDELYRDILSQFRAAQPMAVNVSPDGRYIVTKEELPSGGFQIAVRDVESSRVLYTNFSKNSQRSLTWRPDSRGIVFQEIRGMDRPIYLWELESGRTTKLNAPVSKTALPPLRWDPTGKKLVYFNGDWRTGSLLIIEPEANKDPVVIKHSVGGACNFVWSQDGDRIALITASEPGVVTVASLNPLRLSVINLGGNAKMQDLAWSPDGKSILVSARRDQDEHFNLFEVEPATSRVSLKIEADGDIGNPVWLANGQSFVYHVLFDGNIRALIADREASSSKSIGPTNGVLRVSHVSPDADIGYARFASSTAPPALLRISVQTGESHPVYMPAKSREVECPQPVSIRIPSSDGTLIPAYRWSGHNGTNPPSAVLIEVHGGLHTQTYPTWESYIQVMTRRGCDVIAVNYRGSSGFGQAFENLGDDHERVSDIAAARDYAVNQLKVLPENIYLMGNSNGSRLVAATAVNGRPIGGIALISWVGPMQNLQGHLSIPVTIFGFHGTLDPFLSPREAKTSIRKFFENSNGVEPVLHWSSYKDEGHFFYRTDSWAAICWNLLKIDRSALTQ